MSNQVTSDCWINEFTNQVNITCRSWVLWSVSQTHPHRDSSGREERKLTFQPRIGVTPRSWGRGPATLLLQLDAGVKGTVRQQKYFGMHPGTPCQLPAVHQRGGGDPVASEQSPELLGSSASWAHGCCRQGCWRGVTAIREHGERPRRGCVTPTGGYVLHR